MWHSAKLATRRNRQRSRPTGLKRNVQLRVARLEERSVPAFVGPMDAGGGNGVFAAGDLNGDGRADLVSFNTNNVAVQLGNGDGTFQPAVVYPLPVTGLPTYGGIEVGDFNADGHLDVLTFRFDTLQLLRGNGDGTLQSAVVTTLPKASGKEQGIASVALADLNNDGRLDVVAGASTVHSHGKPSLIIQPFTIKQHVNVLLGNANGTFSSATVMQDVPASSFVAIADCTSDGKPDVLTSSANGVYLFEGRGGGQLKKAVQVTTVGGPMAVADFNSDGKTDFLTIWGGQLNVRLGNGNGSFTLGQSVAMAVPANIRLADMNGDGHLDIVGMRQVHIPGTDNTYPEFSVLLGDGSGTFAPPLTFAYSGMARTHFVLADFNGDGRIDLAYGRFFGGINLLFNDGEW